jgi:cell wall integrity and stress response component
MSGNKLTAAFRHPMVALRSERQGHGQNHERKRISRMQLWLTVSIAVLALSSYITPADARDIVYCSTLNTGDGTDYMTSTYQSNGLCYDHCEGDGYAFAIVQGSDCWCSNYVPGTTVDTSNCDTDCPGYPDDKCGNTDSNLYGYMTAGNKPSGTTGASTTTTATTTSQQTTLTTSTTGKTTSTPGATITQTVGGYTTIIVVPTGSSTSSAAEATGSSSSKGGNFFDNAGRAAGLIVGIILGLCLIGAAVLFYRRRRNRNRAALYDDSLAGGGVAAAGGFGRTRTRSMSTLGLVGEKGQHSPTANGASQVTTGPDTAGEAPSATIYDQRLDPSSLFMRFDHQTGSSRMSVRSLRDDTDYSRRVLRLANPDVEE